jgi:hypothetical protein
VPILPAAKALRDSRKEPNDPYLYCMPQGVVRRAALPVALRADLYGQGADAHVHAHGRKHPLLPADLHGRPQAPGAARRVWFGHSIGYFEGDTLVVDTVGFNDIFWFDRRGHPHTEKLHTIERFTRKDMGHMEIKVTVDDPGAYAKPFTLTFNARLSNKGDELMEYICQENNQYGIAGGYVPERSRCDRTNAVGAMALTLVGAISLSRSSVRTYFAGRCGHAGVAVRWAFVVGGDVR